MALLKKLYYFILHLGVALPAYAIGNPISSNTFGDLIGKIADVLIAIGIPVAAVFIIYAGFMFVSARGNEEQITKAKSNFFWAIVGTLVLTGAKIIATALKNTVEGL